MVLRLFNWKKKSKITAARYLIQFLVFYKLCLSEILKRQRQSNEWGYYGYWLWRNGLIKKKRNRTIGFDRLGLLIKIRIEKEMQSGLTKVILVIQDLFRNGPKKSFFIINFHKTTFLYPNSSQWQERYEPSSLIATKLITISPDRFHELAHKLVIW